MVATGSITPHQTTAETGESITFTLTTNANGDATSSRYWVFGAPPTSGGPGPDLKAWHGSAWETYPTPFTGLSAPHGDPPSPTTRGLTFLNPGTYVVVLGLISSGQPSGQTLCDQFTITVTGTPVTTAYNKPPVAAASSRIVQPIRGTDLGLEITGPATTLFDVNRFDSYGGESPVTYDGGSSYNTIWSLNHAGRVHITCRGAGGYDGGSVVFGSPDPDYSAGGLAAGSFNVEGGLSLDIIIGFCAQGAVGSLPASGILGGGGTTAVWRYTSQGGGNGWAPHTSPPLLMAGGGGGNGYCYQFSSFDWTAIPIVLNNDGYLYVAKGGDGGGGGQSGLDGDSFTYHEHEFWVGYPPGAGAAHTCNGGAGGSTSGAGTGGAAPSGGGAGTSGSLEHGGNGALVDMSSVFGTFATFRAGGGGAGWYGGGGGSRWGSGSNYAVAAGGGGSGYNTGDDQTNTVGGGGSGIGSDSYGSITFEWEPGGLREPVTATIIDVRVNAREHIRVY